MIISIFEKVRSVFAIAFALAAMALVSNAQATIVNYDFNAGLTPATSFGVTGSAVTSGQAITNGPTGTATGAGAFTVNATAGNNVSIPDANATPTNYFQFNLGGGSLTYYTAYKVYVQANPLASASPNTLNVAYDPGCLGTFTNFATTVPITSATWNTAIFDLSGVAALNNKSTNCFRVFGSGTSGANKAMAIDNFQVQATVITAATVTIGGRVSTFEGNAISRARVSMIDSNGAVRTAMTNQFGFYSFADVASGSTYVLSVRAKQYEFAQPTQVVSASEDVSDVNFTALPGALDFRSTEIPVASGSKKFR